MILTLIDRVSIFPIAMFILWITMTFCVLLANKHKKKLTLVVIPAMFITSLLSFAVFLFLDMHNSFWLLFDVIISLILIVNNPITAFGVGISMIYLAVKSEKSKTGFVLAAIAAIVYGVLLALAFFWIYVIVSLSNQSIFSWLHFPIILLILATIIMLFAYEIKTHTKKFFFLSAILVVMTIYADNIRISPIGLYRCDLEFGQHLSFGSYTFSPHSSNLFNTYNQVQHSRRTGSTNWISEDFIYSIHRTTDRNIIRLEFKPSDNHPDGLVGWYYINTDTVRFPSFQEFTFGTITTYRPPRFVGRRSDRRSMFRW